MKFTCEARAFQRGISVVQNVAQSKIANPIVENILLTAEDGQVLFIGTNLTQTLRCTIEAEIQEEGQIAVPAKFIGSLVRELAEGPVEVSLKRNRLHIVSGKSDYRLGGVPAEEFPPFLPLSEGESILFTSAELKEIARKTVFCTSSEKARFELDGIKVKAHENGVHFVATDGRRLSVLKMKRETAVENEVSLLIPTRTWQEMNRVLPEGQTVQITFGENKVMFEAGDVTLLSSLLGDNFPPFEQIIPNQFSFKATVNREVFETAVRRASVLASESTNQVILELDGGEMLVRGESKELGEAKDMIEIQYNGPPNKVSYKGDFIYDFLKAASTEKVELLLNDAVSPAGYKEEGKEEFLHVIMPMKIQEEVPDEESEESEETEEIEE